MPLRAVLVEVAPFCSRSVFRTVFNGTKYHTGAVKYGTEYGLEQLCHSLIRSYAPAVNPVQV